MKIQQTAPFKDSILYEIPNLFSRNNKKNKKTIFFNMSSAEIIRRE